MKKRHFQETFGLELSKQVMLKYFTGTYEGKRKTSTLPYLTLFWYETHHG